MKQRLSVSCNRYLSPGGTGFPAMAWFQTSAFHFLELFWYLAFSLWQKIFVFLCSQGDLGRWLRKHHERNNGVVSIRESHTPAECPAVSLYLSHSPWVYNVSTQKCLYYMLIQTSRKCCSTGLASVCGSGHGWASLLEVTRMKSWHRSGLGCSQTGATGAEALAGVISNQAIILRWFLSIGSMAARQCKVWDSSREKQEHPSLANLTLPTWGVILLDRAFVLDMNWFLISAWNLAACTLLSSIAHFGSWFQGTEITGLSTCSMVFCWQQEGPC